MRCSFIEESAGQRQDSPDLVVAWPAAGLVAKLLKDVGVRRAHYFLQLLGGEVLVALLVPIPLPGDSLPPPFVGFPAPDCIRT
eukprot:CAMPEP_0197930872 /NCGR_PEP_ID=MMETSP1439-20131203/106144_1 /TAXON_ID=66791 /ORGANISM="Gonyaulax spinifera, Strain CCMP409" /LENGTH=82 /DNA_ID=CAMNT_0043553583 /DNA_START=30 /DNA_END=275 /DNA_ORIENTATION=+